MVKHRVHYKGADYVCTSYSEACEHAEMNWRNTNGVVAGGSYFVKLEIDDAEAFDPPWPWFVRLIHLRVDEYGFARLHSSESVDSEVEEVDA